MADFKKQIEEDIADYRERYAGIDAMSNIQKDEWAFNFWVLDKFFDEEEELIVDKITDYNDSGIDAYEWFEATKELYLIQNKFYSDDTKLTLNYVQTTFLVEPVSVLNTGHYTHCPELQKIYSKYSADPEFTIHLQCFVTNNQSDPKIDVAIQNFNQAHGPHIMAEVFYLSDIEEKWFGQPKKKASKFTATIESTNNGTILNIKSAEYQLHTAIDAKYVFTPVTCIFRMVKEAKEKGFELFESNIREYLGNKGTINRRIYNTLKDDYERRNFFYYNNGITMICSKIGSTKTVTSQGKVHIGLSFKVENPQIVNGCQTVNSIFTALSEYDESELDTLFCDTFVMLKILQIDMSDDEQQKLARNIVTYNNSQNSLDEKTFTANAELFQRLKEEFLDKGFLLLTKQSDKAKYAAEYKKKSELTKLQMISIKRLKRFGLDTTLKKVTDFEIPLEKLLQVILAFKVSGQAAYTMKKDVLKQGTDTYRLVTDFIRSGNVTTDVLLDLYLLYIRMEKEKTIYAKKCPYPTPIPFYAIDGFRRYECQGDVKNVLSCLSTEQAVSKLAKLYASTCMTYTNQFLKTNSIDYIKMIKEEIDYSLFENMRDSALMLLL